MIQIETKNVRGKWFCFATFDGYDYSFEGNTSEEAQQQMKVQLKKNDLEGHGLFMNHYAIEQPMVDKASYVGKQSIKIDNL